MIAALELHAYGIDVVNVVVFNEEVADLIDRQRVANIFAVNPCLSGLLGRETIVLIVKAKANRYAIYVKLFDLNVALSVF